MSFVGGWVACKVIYVSNQTTIELNFTLWFSLGCDNTGVRLTPACKLFVC